jgi:small basic protein (TIGR04137 family)
LAVFRTAHTKPEPDMSLDRSLKSKGNLTGVRSVMTRAERVAKMKEDRRFDDKKNSPLGLPKTLSGKR